MTPETVLSGELARSLFLVIRMVLGLAIMAVIAVCVRLAILTFAGTRYHLLGRRKYWWAGFCLLAVGVLEGLRRPVEAVLSTLGNWIGAFHVVPDPAWPSAVLIGYYHTLAATLGLVLAIEGVGALYWRVGRWLAAWRGRSGPAAPGTRRRTFAYTC